MGKGFNNYMCKKFFHPGSRDNLKRVWMAEQKTDAYKKKQEELRIQYEKEQDLYNNKALLSKESKEKLSVNFLYEPPPGMKREREREAGEPEYKFEWQRKFNAPREDYCKGNEEVRDQPFGIQVRNVRCIKCGKWGHINTDRECSLYGQAKDTNGVEMDPLMLMHKMREEEGLAMKHSVLGIRQNAPASNQELLDEPEEDKELIPGSSKSNEEGSDPEAEFLKSLSLKQKKKLLKKLEEIEKKSRKSKKSKKKKSSKSRDKDRERHRKDKDDTSKSKKDRDRPSKETVKASSSRKRRHSSSSSSSSSQSSSSSEDRDRHSHRRDRDSDRDRNRQHKKRR